MDTNVKSLIQEAKEGNEMAFQTLYQNYYQAIFNYAYRLCQNNEEDAKDIAQETFLTAHKSLHQLKHEEYFGLWLKRIAHSKCTRLFQKNKDALYDPTLLKRSYLQEKRVDHDPSKKLNNHTDKEIVHYLIQQLDDKYSESLDLFYFEYLSIQQISQFLNIPEGTVKSRLFLGKKYLKKKIIEFEKKEQRKIAFHLGATTPTLFILLAYPFLKVKDIIKNSGLQMLEISAIAGTIVLGTMAIQEKIQINKQQAIAQVENKAQINDYQFQPIDFQGNAIKTPRNAYFILKSYAPEAEDLYNLEMNTIQQLKPLADELMKTNTNYSKCLYDTGWFKQFQKIVK